jgi:hypothetical protein
MSVASALEDLNNAILAIHEADYNTYDRQIRKLSAALNDPNLQKINDELKAKIAFVDFAANSNSVGSMLGSAQLDWPLEKELELGFAVVLLTPDDFGRAKAELTDKPRARRNVILELGYFVGRLGRDKVCALLKAGIEMPSDYVGTVHINWDAGDAWKFALAKELRAAEYEVDLNKI